jgi:phosphoenolpyruvate-protein phosphotransferase
MSARLTGRPASPGVALAPAFVVQARRRGHATPGAPGTPEQERARLEDALARAQRDLRELAAGLARQVGEEEAAIFLAHAEFAADPEVAARARSAVEQGATAEEAVQRAFDEFKPLLTASGDEYLAARATDVEDVCNTVLDILAGAGPLPSPAERSVIVAVDLTPSETARLPTELIAAIACESGSPTSHAAILARALGSPAVLGVPGLLEATRPGVPVAVDGSSGEVIVDPDRSERAAFDAREQSEAARRARLLALRYELGRTADGRRVEVAANINDPADVVRAQEFGAEGCGLVRTEFLFLDRLRPPDVPTQERHYRDVLSAFPGRRVVFRTMDIGADKPLPFVRREPEENPALGVRGIRLSLVRPELLRAQLRALVRAADAGRLAIMFPMVSRPEELIRSREVLREIAREERVDPGSIEIGVMVEVPAAALAARRLARNADFLSLGTNDLLQYLFAADRLLAEVAELPDLLDPDVLRLVGDVVGAAHGEGAWVGVCGEAAADPVSAAALVGLGVDELSMTPTAIPEVKDRLRRVSHADLAAAVGKAMEAPDAESARALVRAALPG